MLDLPRLVEPVSAESPCGPDLGYDAALLEVERLAAGVPEQRMGWSIRAAVPPDWAAVAERGSALLARSKDWRIAFLLARAALRLEGWKGLEDGVRLLLELETRYGEQVHPTADDDNHDDSWGHALLADLRMQAIGGHDAVLTLGDLEAFQQDGRVIARQQHLDGSDVLRAVRTALSAQPPDLAQSLASTLSMLDDLSLALARRLTGYGRREALTLIQECLERWAHAVRWASDAEDGDFTPMPPFKPPPVAAPPALPPELVTRPRSWFPAPSPALDVATLAEPIEGDASCGPDLEYDPAFIELVQLQSGVPERFVGTQTIPGQAPDWPAVLRLATGLLARTKDLRVAVILTRAATHGDGLRGTASGLALIARLLSPPCWQFVHPVLDADDDDDPTMRLNALAALSAHDGLLGNLRALEIGGADDVLLAGEIEHALPFSGSEAPAWGDAGERKAVETVAAQLEFEPMFAHWVRDARAMLREIAGILDERLGTLREIDGLGPLESFLGGLERVVQAAGPEGSEIPGPPWEALQPPDELLPAPLDAPETLELIPVPLPPRVGDDVERAHALPQLAGDDIERAIALLGRMRDRLDAAAGAGSRP